MEQRLHSAILIDNHGINHFVDDLETRLDDLIKTWDENKKNRHNRLSLIQKQGLILRTMIAEIKKQNLNF